MNDDQPAVIVKNLHKSFRLPIEKHNGIKQAVIGLFNGSHGYNNQKVLNDISFTIKKGEFFGIVGRNGSGKSTLLKLLANIYAPDKGLVHVNGSLMPFIELGVGFNPELTGSENIFLNGALLGFSRKEMEVMYDDIVEFAELEKFMDQKLKNYSSGMQVRLAFSIAIRANSDILLLDEVLAVGDEAFQRKCFHYFAELKRQKKTVILVTHSMEAVQQFCTKALLIKDGNIEYIGDTAKVASLYREENMKSEEIAKIQDDGVLRNKKASIIANLVGKPSDENLEFNIQVTSNEDMPDAVVAISLTMDNGEIVYRWASNEKLAKNIFIKKSKKITFKVKIQNIFPNAEYSLNLGLRNADMTKFYFSADDILRFQVVNKSSYSADVYWKPKESVEVIG